MSENTQEDGVKEEADDVKSQAIIKFQSIPEIPFSQLDLKLDLRLPPANWYFFLFSLPKSLYKNYTFSKQAQWRNQAFKLQIDIQFLII